VIKLTRAPKRIFISDREQAIFVKRRSADDPRLWLVLAIERVSARFDLKGCFLLYRGQHDIDFGVV
jgi:hypothetical protein